jgi:hypothetical protein
MGQRECRGISAERLSGRADSNSTTHTNADTGREPDADADTGRESNANPGSAANTNSHASGVAFTHPDTYANRHGHTNLDPNPGLR